MLNQTSYRRQFGEPPKAAEEYNVMKVKKFTDLEISRFFKKEMQIYIERWLVNSQDDSLVSSLYFTARDMFTFIKQAQNTETSYSHFYPPKVAEKVPRFDQILLRSKQMVSPSKNQNGLVVNLKLKDILTKNSNSTENIKKIDPNEGLFDNNKIGKAMMRGQPFNITEFCELKEPKRSDY